MLCMYKMEMEPYRRDNFFNSIYLSVYILKTNFVIYHVMSYFLIPFESHVQKFRSWFLIIFFKLNLYFIRTPRKRCNFDDLNLLIPPDFNIMNS